MAEELQGTLCSPSGGAVSKKVQGELPGQALRELEPLLIYSLFKGLLEIQKREISEPLNVSMGKSM